MPPERRAVLLLLGLAVAGQGLRLGLQRPGTPPGDLQLLHRSGPPGSPRAHRDSSLAAVRPLGPTERIDLDHAPATEIARLPRVGLGLAKTIVADRTSKGPFGRLEALDRVPGVGPGLLARIEPHAKFSGIPLPAPLPAALAPSAGREDARAPLDLNSATQEDLERLPFLGPYMAAQIVAWRERHGAFASVESLVRVPGVGPATLSRVRSHLRVE